MIEESITNVINFEEIFRGFSERLRRKNFIHWRDLFVQDEFKSILSELNLNGTEVNKSIKSPFRDDKKPSFCINFNVSDPENEFLFIDYATHQQGKGTVQYRMIEEGYSNISFNDIDEYLLREAISRGYSFYGNINKKKSNYINIVDRYYEKVEIIFELLNDEVLSFKKPSLNNLYNIKITVHSFNKEKVLSSINSILTNSFTDEHNENLPFKNQEQLKKSHAFVINNLSKLLDYLENCLMPIYGVFNETGNKLINLYVQDELLFPFHYYDKNIIPLINTNCLQCLEALDNDIIHNNIYERDKENVGKIRNYITFSRENAQNKANLLPTTLIPKKFKIGIRDVTINSISLRHIAHFSSKYTDYYMIDFSCYEDFKLLLLLMASIFNQLNNNQEIVLVTNNGIKNVFEFIFNELSPKNIELLIDNINKDEEDLQQIKQQYESLSNYKKTHFGLLSIRSPIFDIYRNYCVNLVFYLLNMKEKKASFEDVVGYLYPPIKMSKINSLPHKTTNKCFNDLTNNPIRDIQNRINLNNYLALEIAKESHHPEVIKFLNSRGYKNIDVILDKFGIGFGKDNVYQGSLKHLNFSSKWLWDMQYNEKIIKGNIVFPIRIPTHSGSPQTLGFACRNLSDVSKGKYLNSGNYVSHKDNKTVLFDKSKTVYGLYEALPSIIKENQVILVEGYMDVIACSDIHVHNVVAVMGSNINIKKLDMLYPFANQFIIMLDGDLAGLTGMYNLAKSIDSMQKEVENAWLKQKEFYFFVLKDNVDPDDFAKIHRNDFKDKILTESYDLKNFLEYCRRYFILNIEKNNILNESVSKIRKNNLFNYVKIKIS